MFGLLLTQTQALSRGGREEEMCVMCLEMKKKSIFINSHFKKMILSTF